MTLTHFPVFGIFPKIHGYELNETATSFDNFYLESFREIVNRLKEIEENQDSEGVNKKGQGLNRTVRSVQLLYLSADWTSLVNPEQEEKLICDMILLCVVSSACMQYFRICF